MLPTTDRPLSTDPGGLIFLPQAPTTKRIMTGNPGCPSKCNTSLFRTSVSALTGWVSETTSHYSHDLTFSEDRSRIRTVQRAERVERRERNVYGQAMIAGVKLAVVDGFITSNAAITAQIEGARG